MSLSDKITKKGNITAENVREAVKELIKRIKICDDILPCIHCQNYLLDLNEIFGEELCK